MGCAWITGEKLADPEYQQLRLVGLLKKREVRPEVRLESSWIARISSARNWAEDGLSHVKFSETLRRNEILVIGVGGESRTLAP